MPDDRQDDAERHDYIDIVFDGPPGPEAGRFVEVESPAGTGISFGKWLQRQDGYWVLRFERDATIAAKDAEIADLNAELREHEANALKQDAEIAALRAENDQLRLGLQTIIDCARYPTYKSDDLSFLRATVIVCREQAEQALTPPQEPQE